MKVTGHPAEQVAATEPDPDLVAELDDDALLLSLDAASDGDRRVLMAEVVRRGLGV